MIIIVIAIVTVIVIDVVIAIVIAVWKRRHNNYVFKHKDIYLLKTILLIYYYSANVKLHVVTI